MTQQPQQETVYQGKHLSMVQRGKWEYATRSTDKPAVGIVAITDEGNVVLVEQFRPPVGKPVVELPAGLAGDVQGQEDEALLEAARRELLEETGYRAQRWTELGMGYSSPGLTDEAIVLYLAEELEKQTEGGGDEHEEIVLHEVPLDAVTRWLAERNLAADMKLLAGVYLAKEKMK